MLNNILRQAYKEMSTNIDDFERYVDIDDISIEYHDFGTDFDTEEYVSADICVKISKIRLNIFSSKRYFMMGKLYNRLKICRKEAFRAYKENVKSVKHELLHLYLYNKYKDCKNKVVKEGKEVHFYDDDNIIFVMYCMVLGIRYNNDITKYKKIYNKCLEISEQYKNCYGNDVNKLNHFFKLRLLDMNDFMAFNEYSIAKTLVEKFMGEKKKIILKAIDIWENKILDDFDMLSILIKIDEKSA